MLKGIKWVSKSFKLSLIFTLNKNTKEVIIMNRRVKELQMNDFTFKPTLSSNTVSKTSKTRIAEGQPIQGSMKIVFKQMEIQGLRSKTLISYKKTFVKFIEFIEVDYVEEINREVLLNWLDSFNNHEPTTKKNNYRFITSVLNRFYDNGWLKEKFWRDIKIKVPRKLQPPAQENELEILLSLIDTSKWIGFRDVCVLLLLYKTGIRINTLVSLKEKHIDFDNKELALSGEIMKNGQNLRLPLDDEMLELLKRLIQQNRIVRKRYNENNDFVFISKSGITCQSDTTNTNTISKRLHHYATKYGLKTISPHKIRRLYSTNLLRKGANIGVISKALGHSSLSVTEKYLSLTEQEISKTLREYL